MTFVMMEGAALVVTVLMGLEMRRQRVPWRAVVIRSAIALAILTMMIAMWRGQ